MKKYFSFLFALLVAFSSVFVSCDKSDPDLDSTICKITVASTDGGKVKITKYLETSEIVLLGSEIEVVATPDEGYVFTGWYVGNSTEPVSTDAVFTFVATRNTTLTAHFVKPSEIIIRSAGNGRVSFKDMTGTSHAILPGTEVTVVATPDKNCDFIGWYINNKEIPVSSDAKYTFTVTENIILIAKFSDPVGEAIDLGLPSGTKWANMNVGAYSPEDYGGYYAWGETEEKEDYSWSTYKWCNGSVYTITKYCINSDYGAVDNNTVLDPEDDVAHVIWGGSWRMPTLEELKELLNNCIWTWRSQNGVNGYRVTGPNGNSIFLPAAGYCDDMVIEKIGYYGYYWTSSISSYDGNNYCPAYDLGFGSGGRDIYSDSRFGGHCVRPVSD